MQNRIYKAIGTAPKQYIFGTPVIKESLKQHHISYVQYYMKLYEYVKNIVLKMWGFEAKSSFAAMLIRLCLCILTTFTR